MPLFLVMLNLAGILTHERFRKWRRLIIFLVFVFAGIASPSPDPLTMLLLGGIVVVLVEVAEVFIYFNDKRYARNHPDPYAGLADDELSPIDAPEPVDADSQILAARLTRTTEIEVPSLGGMSTPAVSPAERYAKFRERQAAPEFTSFRELYDFDFDPFQVAACAALTDGDGVLVAAPTGSGKTVVAEYAVHLALQQGQKCFYTTPIKALSNQKYSDLVRRYGTDTVGLLTGDNAINGDAPVVVMTTEVLRNMIYAGSPALQGPRLRRPRRGALPRRPRPAAPVWEEVIIHLPERVRVVAPVGDGVQRRGVRRLDRPGARRHRRSSSRSTGRCRCGSTCWSAAGCTTCSPTTTTARSTRSWSGWRTARRSGQPAQARPGRGGRRGRRRNAPAPYRPEIVDRLDAAGLLPAITFIFSRAGCDAAVQQCLAAGLRLTTPDEARDHRGRSPTRRTADIPDEDLDRPRLPRLGARAAARHRRAPRRAWCPPFKEVVEELFTAGPGQGGVRHRDPGARHQHARPHRGASRSSTSGPASATSRSPRGSTPSSPAGRAAAASTSRGTRSCSGSRASTRARWRASPAPAPTRSTPASAPPTTWPST